MILVKLCIWKPVCKCMLCVNVKYSVNGYLILNVNFEIVNILYLNLVLDIIF